MKSFFRKLRHKAILQHMTFVNNTSVLDTSCQDGSFLKVLLDKNSNRNLRIFGVDISQEDIMKAQKTIPDGVFFVTDNKTLPIPDQAFDAVITSLTLHHMVDPMASLSEMKRVLKDNGCIYLVDIIPRNLLVYKVFNLIRCREPYHFEKFYSLSEVKDLVTKIGLKTQEVNSVSVFPLTSVMPIAIIKLYK